MTREALTREALTRDAGEVEYQTHRTGGAGPAEKETR
jgi:hypothetical protein